MILTMFSMKINKSTKNALLTLIEHSCVDLSFGEEGTHVYVDESGERAFDKKSAKQTKQAIEFIKQLVILG